MHEKKVKDLGIPDGTISTSQAGLVQDRFDTPGCRLFHQGHQGQRTGFPGNYFLASTGICCTSHQLFGVSLVDPHPPRATDQLVSEADNLLFRKPA